MVDKIRKYVFIDKINVAWLEDTYPGASLSKTLNMLLTEFKTAHHIDPKDVAAIGAKALKDSLEEK